VLGVISGLEATEELCLDRTHRFVTALGLNVSFLRTKAAIKAMLLA
jgi:hypothetical protein